MAVKRARAKVIPIHGCRKELEQLNARRSAIVNLIELLKEYDRFRAKRLDLRKRKTA
jgi:hypothetical protein